MTWLVAGLVALGAVIVTLGHLRLRHRQADVEATHRQIAALLAQAAALPPGPARSRLEARQVWVTDLYHRELARYRATPGARLNRWRPPALPSPPG